METITTYQEKRSEVQYTEEEMKSIMLLIEKMIDKGKFLSKSVEMLAYNMGRPASQLKSKVRSLMKKDPNTRGILTRIKSTYSVMRKQKTVKIRLEESSKNSSKIV